MLTTEFSLRNHRQRLVTSRRLHRARNQVGRVDDLAWIDQVRVMNLVAVGVEEPRPVRPRSVQALGNGRKGVALRDRVAWRRCLCSSGSRRAGQDESNQYRGDEPDGCCLKLGARPLPCAGPAVLGRWLSRRLPGAPRRLVVAELLGFDQRAGQCGSGRRYAGECSPNPCNGVHEGSSSCAVHYVRRTGVRAVPSTLSWMRQAHQPVRTT